MYTLRYLPSAVADVLEIENSLHEYSSAAADKFADSIERLADRLSLHPFMYPVYEDGFFRHMTLPYQYRLFYRVDEERMTIIIHRILHGMRDIKSIIDAEICSTR